MVVLLGCNCIVLVAGYFDQFRKPAMGSFRYLQSLFRSPIDLKSSFYCGDFYGWLQCRRLTAREEAEEVCRRVLRGELWASLLHARESVHMRHTPPSHALPPRDARLRSGDASEPAAGGHWGSRASQGQSPRAGIARGTPRLGQVFPVRDVLPRLRASESGRAEDPPEVPAEGDRRAEDEEVGGRRQHERVRERTALSGRLRGRREASGFRSRRRPGFRSARWFSLSTSRCAFT